MNRRHFVWKLRERELLTGERTLIMAVLNVTPDSFSDGGKYLDPDRAFARAIELAQPHDIVLIAGKGHEDYQIYGETRRTFSDRREAQRHLGVAA